MGTLTIVQLWVLLGDTRTVTPVGPTLHLPCHAADNLLAFMVQTLPRSCVLPDLYPYGVLYGSFWYPFPLLG